MISPQSWAPSPTYASSAAGMRAFDLASTQAAETSAPVHANPFDDKVRALQANQQVYETLHDLADAGSESENAATHTEPHPEATAPSTHAAAPHAEAQHGAEAASPHKPKPKPNHGHTHTNTHTHTHTNTHSNTHNNKPTPPPDNSNNSTTPAYSSEAERTAHTVDKPQSPFVATVQNNFVKWDTNQDGVLDANEVDHAMADSTNKGDAAAALGVLETHETGHQDFSFSAKDLLDTEKDKGAGPNDQEMWWRQQNIKSYDQRTSLYAPDGMPKLNDINQGSSGDCYFLSALGAKVKDDPQAVKDMIKQNQDGTFTVAFSKGSVTIDAPTEAEASRSAHNADQGRWVDVMEKAFAEYRKEQQGVGADVDPYEAIDHGGWMTGVYEDLGSKNTASYSLQSSTGGLGDLADPGMSIKTFLDEGKMVTASTPDTTKSGLPGNHAYTVEGFDPNTQMITIRNPWGFIGVPDATKAGLKDLGSGQFAMNVKDFVNNFDFIAVG